jgi:ABC-type multidrug transport system fused ATPase/permease subunit
MTGDQNLKIEDRRKATEDRRKATQDRRKSNRKTADEKRLLSGILWLNARVLGLALGLIFGLSLFIATNWLVIKGGQSVGPHLELLSQYFIGYRVTFLGSFIGFAYGFAVGTLSGALIGWIYNRILAFRIRDVVKD